MACKSVACCTVPMAGTDCSIFPTLPTPAGNLYLHLFKSAGYFNSGDIESGEFFRLYFHPHFAVNAANAVEFSNPTNA